MIEELLKIVFEAEQLIVQHQVVCLNEKIHLITSGFRELEEIEHKVSQHFKEQHIH